MERYWIPTTMGKLRTMTRPLPTLAHLLLTVLPATLAAEEASGIPADSWLDSDSWPASIRNQTGMEGSHYFFSYSPAWDWTAPATQLEERPLLLHCFERNPALLVELAASPRDRATRAEFSILLRWNDHASHLCLSFDLGKQRIQLREKIEGHKETRLVAETVAPDFSLTRQLIVFCEQNALSLIIDGELAFRTEDLRHRNFGQLGLISNGARLELSRVQAAGVNGAPVRDVTRFPLRAVSEEGELWGNQVAVAETANGKLIGILAYHDRKGSQPDRMRPLFVLESETVGEDWNSPIRLDDSSCAHRLETSRGPLRYNWPQLTRLQSGRLLTFGFVNGDQPAFVASDDHGETWQIVGDIEFPDGSFQNKQIMPGKTFQDRGGTLHAVFAGFYFRSQDEGATWVFESLFPNETDTTQEYSFVESEQSLDLLYRDGRPGALTLGRSSLAAVRSFTDPDEWPTNNTPFVSPKAAFNIQPDPFEPGTYYCAWIYNDRRDDLWRNNGPRTRVALAVSHDQAKTWEFLMDVEDWGYPFDTGWTHRDARYVNLFLHVGKAHLYLTSRRQNKDLLLDPSAHASMAGYEPHFIRVSKASLPDAAPFPGPRY